MKETASAPPAPGPFLCADQSGTGDRCRNCLVTGDGGWHVTLAQTQSTGEPVQRVADTMVDRIFCSFRSTRSILTTRARLTSLTLENAPAAVPRGGGAYLTRTHFSLGERFSRTANALCCEKSIAPYCASHPKACRGCTRRPRSKGLRER